jgi:hypothetical protein
LKKLKFIFSLLAIILFAGKVSADDTGIGFGLHAGYGVATYKEDTDAFGKDTESIATLDTIIFGASIEYSLPAPQHFYIGGVTDFLFGLEDVETWQEDDVKVQMNDISIDPGIFLDGRLGYKNSVGNFYYRLYGSFGWDGIYFRRRNFKRNGVATSDDVITEDFSLWRGGGGLNIGYSFDTWAIDGRAAYAHYFDGEIRNSSQDGIVFEANGTCLDFGTGLAFDLTERMKLYGGVSYTYIKLDESDVDESVTQSGNVIKVTQVVFPNSRTQILTGVVNLTFAF